MNRDKHYIDEKELWKVTIELEDDQIRSEKVTNLVDYPSLYFRSLFFSTVTSEQFIAEFQRRFGLSIGEPYFYRREKKNKEVFFSMFPTVFKTFGKRTDLFAPKKFPKDFLISKFVVD